MSVLAHICEHKTLSYVSIPMIKCHPCICLVYFIFQEGISRTREALVEEYSRERDTEDRFAIEDIGFAYIRILNE